MMSVFFSKRTSMHPTLFFFHFLLLLIIVCTYRVCGVFRRQHGGRDCHCNVNSTAPRKRPWDGGCGCRAWRQYA